MKYICQMSQKDINDIQGVRKKIPPLIETGRPVYLLNNFFLRKIIRSIAVRYFLLFWTINETELYRK